MVRRKTTGKGSEIVKKRAARFKAIKARKGARKLRDEAARNRKAPLLAARGIRDQAARKRARSTRRKDARIRRSAYKRMRRNTAAAIKKVTGK